MKDYLKFEQNPKLSLNNDIAALSKINDRLTEENFILFKKLILDSLPFEYVDSHDQKYSVTTYRLTNPDMPSIEVCIENLSRYTKHAYMCINSINKTEMFILGLTHFVLKFTWMPSLLRSMIYQMTT